MIIVHCHYGYIPTAYTEVGEDEDLPLGEEFQDLVKWFSTEDRNHYVDKIIKQLL